MKAFNTITQDFERKLDLAEAPILMMEGQKRRHTLEFEKKKKSESKTMPRKVPNIHINNACHGGDLSTIDTQKTISSKTSKSKTKKPKRVSSKTGILEIKETTLLRNTLDH